jgi:hypothetical protein
LNKNQFVILALMFFWILFMFVLLLFKRSSQFDRLQPFPFFL